MSNRPAHELIDKIDIMEVKTTGHQVKNETANTRMNLRDISDEDEKVTIEDK